MTYPVIHQGQFGSTVYQYADHYQECQQLVCVTNPGQWNPMELVYGDWPTRPGRDDLELLHSADGKRNWVWIKSQERWIVLP